MKLSHIFISAGVMMLAAVTLTSCEKGESNDWTSGVGTLDPNGASFTKNSQIVRLGWDTEYPAETFTCELRRVSNQGAATYGLVLLVSDGENYFLADPDVWSCPAAVTIPDGEYTVNVPVSFKSHIIGKYTAYLLVADGEDSTDGAINPTTLIADVYVPPIWESLGTGIMVNGFLADEPYEVEVQKDMAVFPDYAPGYCGHYRFVKPLAGAFEQDDYFGKITGPDYQEFYVMGPGQNIPLANGKSLPIPATSRKYYVMYDSFNTGWHHSSYDADVWCYYPASLEAIFEDGVTLLNFAGNVVADWVTAPTTANPAGSPGVIYNCAVYWMDGVGGWDYSASKFADNFSFYFPAYLED